MLFIISAKRLGLLIEEGAKAPKTSSLNIPEELLAIEGALNMLARALYVS